MMELFLEYFVAVGIIIYGVRRFLVLRKYWHYRQEQDAAEGISVIARTISLGVTVPFLFKFVIIDRSTLLATKELIDLIVTGGILLIGMGLWVQTNRSRNPMQLFVRAIRLEKREALREEIAGDSPAVLASILQTISEPSMDSDTAVSSIYTDFATRWQIELEIPPSSTPSTNNLIETYISQMPPKAQAAHLYDILAIQDSMHADQEVERLLNQEATALLESYIGLDDHVYEVVVVPQNREQQQVVAAIDPTLTLESRKGGKAYLVGKYYSIEAASQINAWFIDKSLFCVVEAVS